MKIIKIPITILLLFMFLSLFSVPAIAQDSKNNQNSEQKKIENNDSTEKKNNKQVSDSELTWYGVGISFLGPTAIIGFGVVNWWTEHKIVIAADRFVMRDRGWFGEYTYSGGHDKVGHFYSHYVLQYTFTGMYEWGGFKRNTAIWMSAGITFLGSNLIEMFDSFTDYGWEWGDSVANTLGQGLAIMGQFYGIDRYVQMRISWIPSVSYINKEMKQYQIMEDYNGQRFFLMMSTAGVANRFGWNLGFAKYLAPAIYYDTRGYRPELPENRTWERERNLGLALLLDFQAISYDINPHSKFWRGLATFFRFYQPSIFIGYGYDFNHKRWHSPDLSVYLTTRFE